MDRLTAIRAALLRELAGNETRLRFINTRLILTVGVDLNEIGPREERDKDKVKLTVETLNKMGFLNQKEGSHGA